MRTSGNNNHGVGCKGIFLDLDDTLYPYALCNDAGVTALLDFLAHTFGISKDETADFLQKGRTAVKSQIPNFAASHSRLLYIQNAIERITGSTHPHIALDAESSFWNAYYANMRLRDGVIHFLETARRSKVSVTIVSDLVSHIQMQKIITLGIESYLTFLVTSEESGADKPAICSFELALKKTGLQPREVFMIGEDYEKDICPAEQLGIRGILLSSDAMKRQHPLCYGTFSEIEEYLFGGYDGCNANSDSNGRDRQTLS